MKRMNVVRIVYLILICTLLAGCSDLITERGDGDTISVLCVFPEPDTKTAMSTDQASFTANDKVGIFETLTGKSNVLYTYGTPAWATSAPMYWKDYNSQHQFYAYYPYNASNSGTSITIPVLSGQSLSPVPDPKSDLLASSLVQKKTTAVNLGFTHAFALFKFNVSFTSALLSTLLPGRIIIYGGNLAASSVGPYGMFNSVNALNKISYDLSSGVFSYSPNDITVFQQSLSANLPALSSGSTTVYVLALPGTYNNPQPYVQFSAKIILSGLEIYSTTQSLGVTKLSANTRYEYNVSIIKKILTKGGDTDPFQVLISPV